MENNLNLNKNTSENFASSNINKKRTNFKNKNRRTKKIDCFISERVEGVDYKNVDVLKKFLNRQGRIVKGIQTQLTSKNQRIISRLIKRARQMGLIPYIIEDQNE
jgi:small subunit ribosomal protein S18